MTISNRVVHKFILPDLVGAPFTLMIPRDHSVLSIQERINSPEKDPTLCMWALVDPSHVGIKHEFKTIFTGQQFLDEDDYMFLSTVQGRDGLVRHIFKKIKGY